jgi:hypothetical protein
MTLLSEVAFGIRFSLGLIDLGARPARFLLRYLALPPTRMFSDTDERKRTGPLQIGFRINVRKQFRTWRNGPLAASAHPSFYTRIGSLLSARAINNYQYLRETRNL